MKWVKWSIGLILGLLLLAFVALVVATEPVLNAVLRDVARQLKEEQGVVLTLGKVEVKGLLTVELSSLLVQGSDQKVVFYAKRARAVLSPLAYLFDSIPVSVIEVEEPDIFVQIDSSSEPFDPDISFGLRHVQVSRGRVHLQRGNQEAVIRDVNAKLKRAGPNYQVDLSIGESSLAIAGKWVDVWDAHANFEVKVKELFNPKRVLLKRLQLRSNELRLGASGTVALGPDRALSSETDLQIQALGRIDAFSRHFKLPVWIAGEVAFEGRVHHPRESAGWHYEGAVHAKQIEISDMQFASFDANVLANRFGLHLNQAVAHLGGRDVQFSVMADFDEELHFSGTLEAQKLSLYELLYDLGIRRAWTELELDLHAQVEGQVFPSFLIHSKAKGEARNLLVADGPVQDLVNNKTVIRTARPIQIEIGMVVDAHSYRFEEAHVSDGLSQGVVNCSLFFDKAKGMLLDTRFDRFDFASIGNAIADNSYEGAGSISGSIWGPYKDLTILGVGRVSNFFFEGFELGNLEGEAHFRGDILSFRDLQGALKNTRYEGALALDFEGLTRMDLKAQSKRIFAEDLRAAIPEDGAIEALGSLRNLDWVGPFEAKVHLEGPIKKGCRDGIVGAAQATLLPGTKLYSQDLSSGDLSFELSPSMASLKRFQLKADTGFVEVRAQLSKAELGLEADVEIKELRLEPLSHALVRTLGLKGNVNLGAHLSGTLRNLKGEGKLTASALEVEGVSLGDIDLALALAQKELSLQGTLLSSKADLDLKTELYGDLPFSANLRLQYAPLKPIFTRLEIPAEMELFAGANLELEGSLRHWRDAKGRLALYPAAVTYSGLKFSSVGEVRARLEQGVFDVERLVFQTAHGDSVRVQGRVSKSQINLNVKANGDLWILPYFDDRVDSAFGDFSVDLTMSGDFHNPSFIGSGQVDRAVLSLRDYPSTIDNLVVRASFDRYALRLPVLRGQSKKGSFDGQGEVTLKNYRPVETNLGFRFNEIPFAISSWLNGTASGQLKLAGPNDNLLLSGDVRILDALVTREIDFDRLAYEFGKKPRVFDARRTKGKPLQLNVHVVADKGIVIENSSMQAELGLNLNIIGTKDAVGARGSLAFLSGSAYFRGAHYRLLKVRADFDDPYRIWPNFDVEAESRIEDYDVLVRLTGTLDKPRFQLTSRPSLSEQDVLSLVALGVTTRDVKDVMGTARYAGLEALSAYSGLGSKIVQMLPSAMQRSRTLSLDELRLTSVFSQRGGVTLPAVVVGMDVWRGMRLRLQSTLVENPSGTREQRFELEQSLNRDTRWRFVWNSEGSSNYGDAGVDLWYRWEF